MVYDRHPHHRCRTGHRSEYGSTLVNHLNSPSAEREEGDGSIMSAMQDKLAMGIVYTTSSRGLETRQILVDIGQAGTQFRGVRDMLLDLF